MNNSIITETNGETKMARQVKIPGVRACILDDDDFINKSIVQNSPGSAWLKVPGFILLIKKAGYNRVRLNFNTGHVNLRDIIPLIDMLRERFPEMRIKTNLSLDLQVS